MQCEMYRPVQVDHACLQFVAMPHHIGHLRSLLLLGGLGYQESLSFEGLLPTVSKTGRNIKPFKFADAMISVTLL